MHTRGVQEKLVTIFANFVKILWKVYEFKISFKILRYFRQLFIFYERYDSWISLITV